MASLGFIEPADGTLRLTPRGRLVANDVVSNVTLTTTPALMPRM